MLKVLFVLLMTGMSMAQVRYGPMSEQEQTLFNRLQRHVASKETATGEDYAAANPKSSARGKYQFLKDSPSTRVWEKAAGLKGPEDWEIQEGDSPAEIKRKSDNQELLFRTAYERDYKPGAEQIRKLNPDLDPVQAMSLIHFQGLSKAKEYAKTGHEPDDPNNIPISDYLNLPGKTSMPDKPKKKSASSGFMGWDNVGAFASEENEKLMNRVDGKPATRQEAVESLPRNLQAAVAKPQPKPEEAPAAKPAAMKPVVNKDTGEGKPEAVTDNLTALEQGLNNLPSGTLTDSERKRWKDEIQSIRDRAKAEMSSIRRAEIAERIGHALSRMFAAMHGLKTGQDMSGVKFEKTDWNNRMSTAMKMFDEELSATKQAESDAARDKASTRAEKRQALLDKLQVQRARQAEQKTTAKSLNKAIADAEKKNAKLEQDVNKIIGSDKDPDEKAKQLSVLLNADISADDLDRDKPGWFTGDYSWNEIKQSIMAKAGKSEQQQPSGNEVERQTEDGRIAIFDANTKQFLRYK